MHIFRTCILCILSFSLYCQKQNIEFWHAFEGFLFDQFNVLVEEFNTSQDEYNINLVYQGNYLQTYEKTILAHKESKHPAIAQIYEVANASMINEHKISIPFEDIMKKYSPEFNKLDFINVIRQFYSDSNSCLQSMPFNASTGVLYYNKALIEKAGINADELDTYAQFEKALIKAKNSGVIGYTTAWPAAYHVEHLCCLHNIAFAENENGFLNPKAKICYLNPLIINHFNNLRAWQKEGLFSYQGRFTQKPEALFKQGKCAFLMQGANRFTLLQKGMKDEIGVARLPFYNTVTDQRYNLNIGGASFWALKGFKKETYKGIAKFFSFLLEPKTMAYWHQKTGYLPVTKTAYILTTANDFYTHNKVHEIAVESVINGYRPVYPHTKGVRLDNYTKIRDEIIDNLEAWIDQ